MYQKPPKETRMTTHVLQSMLEEHLRDVPTDLDAMIKYDRLKWFNEGIYDTSYKR